MHRGTRRRATPLALALTMQGTARQVRLAFAAGANGHASKQESTETLLLAMRSLFRGETYGAPEN